MTELATRMEQQVAVQKSGGNKTVFDEVLAMKGAIERALPKTIEADRFLRLIQTQLRTVPKLASCSIVSIRGAMMTAAQLGLEPDARGLAYLIPRWNSRIGCNEATFLIGYKGYLDLARRSGQITSVDAQVVYSNDEFDFRYGLQPKLDHRPALKDRGEPICAYAVATFKDGGHSFVILDNDEIERRRGRSAAGDKGPWKTDEDAMKRKTCIRALSAYLPQTVELALANAFDETVRTDSTSSIEEIIVPEDDVSDVEEAIEIPAVPTAAGEPEVPDSTSDDGVDSGEGAIPLPPSPESPEDGLDLLSDEELGSLCDAEKLSNNGSRAQVIVRIRKHWQKLNLK